jgi:hypothetical protein
MLSLSLLAGLLLGWGGAAEAAPSFCALPTPSAAIGPGDTKVLTYTATDPCEGYEFDLRVPPAGGTFSLLLTVQAGPSPLGLLQIFNDSEDIYRLFVDGAPQTWQQEDFDEFYYQFADPGLFRTAATYDIAFRTVDDNSPPYGPRATVRLGGSAVIPAIPLPAPALLLLSGIAALGWRGRAVAQGRAGSVTTTGCAARR